jgi:putative glutamine amidotransferase
VAKVHGALCGKHLSRPIGLPRRVAGKGRQIIAASAPGVGFESAPLIAVTTSEIRAQHPAAPTPEGEPAQQEMALGLRYLRAIQAVGGVPVVVPPIREEGLLESLLDRVSGLCLSGGPDLDPDAYGALRHGMLGPTWRDLDDCELALARLADRRQMPILAICRGLQAVNVARGGTLDQHLPDHPAQLINHRQTEPGEQATHWVSLIATSALAEIAGSHRFKVNSFHHQAAAELGEGLLVTGRADDGTIESVEASDRDFLIGVQWHAEALTADPGQRALFGAFTDAARRYESGSERLRSVA